TRGPSPAVGRSGDLAPGDQARNLLPSSPRHRRLTISAGITTMRMVNAVIAVALTAAVVACSAADTPTGPSGIRAPSYGVNAESPNGAWVQTQTGVCNMVGSDANGGLIGGGAGSISTKVQNNNKLMITCKGTGIINLSGQDQIFRGFNCTVL